MTNNEKELLEAMQATKELIASRHITGEALITVILARLHKVVHSVRTERGDIDRDIALPSDGMVRGTCPDCGSEYDANCFTCSRYAESVAEDIRRKAAKEIEIIIPETESNNEHDA